ncbi:MAG: SPFH domain-containing protein [Bacteroidales bacterium]
MNTEEIKFKGFRANGFLMLFILLIMIIAEIFMIRGLSSEKLGALFTGLAIVIPIIILFYLAGFFVIQPNEARVMIFFGKYKGTFKENGFFWSNPFLSKIKLSLRSRNLDIPPIKVNDKMGNPVLIGLVMVWKIKDTYKCMFDIDASTAAPANPNINSRMSSFQSFVSIQSDAALRQVAGQYAYDNNENEEETLTLRGGNTEINQELITKLNERLDIAGISIVEARINYLAYAPEIAAVMLRRQQASAIISAREKIVEGAVSMVEMALNKLAEDKVVDFDNDRKAAMVSNLMVVLCADESAQPIINTSSEA